MSAFALACAANSSLGGKLRVSVDRLSSVAPSAIACPPDRGRAGRHGYIARLSRRSCTLVPATPVCTVGPDRSCPRSDSPERGEVARWKHRDMAPARTTDPLAPLLDLPGVAAAVARAREALVAVHNHPVNRRGWPASAAEASIRAARAS